MKKTTHLLGALTFVVGLGFVSVGQAQATYMEQHQSSHQKVTTECSGGCSFNVTNSLEQHQSFGSNSGSGSWHGGWEDRGWMNSKKWSHANRNGHVSLSWDHRGGTCHVRYTENVARNFKYHTSAACDNGGMTIGGLVPGRSYRFQVKQDDGSWSHSRVLRAW